MQKNNDFKIRIANVGTDNFSAGYKTMKDKDALNLAKDVCVIMSQNFISKGQRTMFLAHLSYCLLGECLIEDFDIDNTIKNIKESNEFIGKWVMSE